MKRKEDTLTRANEASTMYASAEENREDRAIFVRNLGWLLSQTRDQVTGAEYIYNPEWDQEIVEITYKDGYRKQINITYDSYGAILRDVAKKYQ